MEIEEGPDPTPAELADTGRDLAALLRTFPGNDRLKRAVILNGAEDSGTLRALADELLQVAREPFLRCVLAQFWLESDDPVSAVRAALNGDLDTLLAFPGVREALDEYLAGYQAEIIGEG